MLKGSPNPGSPVRIALCLLFLLAPLVPRPAAAQCLLANPSFELAGGGGAAFAGWNQFGLVAGSPEALHGSTAARLVGQGGGSWEVSGAWQRLDSAPGEQWRAAVRARVDPAMPLAGGARAILNIEWRDSAGNLLGYDSQEVADPSTPTGVWVEFEAGVVTVPAGTAAIHFLLGTLQGPGDPTPAVAFDLARLERLGPPTQDELQWGDFPGGRTLAFAGRSWRVKGPGYYGPGPNVFCDDPDCSWVDAQGRLHLTISGSPGNWSSTEVVLEDALGYGDYRFTTVGAVHAIDPQAVLGLFLWEYRRCYDPAEGWWSPYNEIDVELSRWGDPGNGAAQFVVQPWDFPGNIERFDPVLSPGELATWAFSWRPDGVEYRAWRGGPHDEATAPPLHAWSYDGPHIPRPEQPRVHLNLWHLSGGPAAPQEVVLEDFVFVPYDAQPVAVPWGATSLQLVASPNPASQRATVGFRLPEGARVELAVFDARGRRVRTLARRDLGAGPQQLQWDGRDEAGRVAPAGIYHLQLRAGGHVESRRITWLR